MPLIEVNRNQKQDGTTGFTGHGPAPNHP